MKTILKTTTILIILSSTAFAGDFVKPLNKDVTLLPKWNRVLKEQPVISGKGSPTVEALEMAFNSIKLSYVEDYINYTPLNQRANKTFDYWATPDEMLSKGSGDCEDFAISWYYAARALGFKANQLNIWFGALEGQPHAVLAVKIGEQEWILDSYDMSMIPAEIFSKKNFSKMYRVNENGWEAK